MFFRRGRSFFFVVSIKLLGYTIDLAIPMHWLLNRHGIALSSEMLITSHNTDSIRCMELRAKVDHGDDRGGLGNSWTAKNGILHTLEFHHSKLHGRLENIR